MSRLMFPIALIAALSGTPLRQAEAAHDLARTIAELDRGSLVEEADGGVGDDAHIALAVPVEPDRSPDARDGGLPPPADFAPPAPRLATVRPARGAPPPPDRSGRRQARLQRFLF